MSVDDTHDAAADEAIRDCLSADPPQSFFLYAGAGSGKTRSLVSALEHILKQRGPHLNRTGQTIGVITYTNAAADEIRHRLRSDTRIEVSTLHAFAWGLLSGYHDDIRAWLAGKLKAEIEKLEDEQTRSRKQETFEKRARKIELKQAELARLPDLRTFTYSPTGRNDAEGALQHAQVIQMASDLLQTRPTLRAQLIARHPILLIDESQDTIERLMVALLAVRDALPDRFALGLFGDTMQRIYYDGKADLAEAVQTWDRPAKAMNHRCAQRIVRLVNAVRADDDGQRQRARSDATEGHVRLFLAPAGHDDPAGFEREACARMATVTGDADWTAGEVKHLALEHRIAARREGFLPFFDPLHACAGTRQAVRDGDGTEMTFLRAELLPLLDALSAGNRFAVMSHLRDRSPLLARDRFEDGSLAPLAEARAACEALSHVLGAKGVRLSDVVDRIASSRLLDVPALLGVTDDGSEERTAWAGAMGSPVACLGRYHRYAEGNGRFSTHHGVKGLEFPRVLAVLSDQEARGRGASYDKLFGPEGQCDAVAATRRLFYVICSRARKGLAVVLHTEACDAVKEIVIKRGWFAAEEVVPLNMPL